MEPDPEGAATVLRDAVAAFTERATTPGDDDELAAAEWAVLRALADFRESVSGPDRPGVLGWVPPVEDLDDSSGDADSGDKVMQVATWFFSVADADQVVVAGRERVAAVDTDADVPVRSVSDVVGTLAEAEIDWPDIDAYQAMGLSIESAHFFTQVLHPER